MAERHTTSFGSSFTNRHAVVGKGRRADEEEREAREHEKDGVDASEHGDEEAKRVGTSGKKRVCVRRRRRVRRKVLFLLHPYTLRGGAVPGRAVFRS